MTVVWLVVLSCMTTLADEGWWCSTKVGDGVCFTICLCWRHVGFRGEKVDRMVDELQQLNEFSL